MAVWALGINHTTAPLDLRGRFAFAIDQIAPTLQALRQSFSHHPEAAIISTCNRTEIYCAGEAHQPDHTLDWLAHCGGVSPAEVSAADAVRLALLNNPDMKAEYASLGFAAADVYEAGRMANPVLSASVLFPDTGDEANQIGFGLAQDFTDVLLLRSRSRLADGEYARARELIGAKALALAADTEAAHVRVVGSWQLIAMREAVAQAATVSAELAARFHAAGNIGRLELALQQAAASEAKLDVLQARARAPRAPASNRVPPRDSPGRRCIPAASRTTAGTCLLYTSDAADE